MQVHCILCGGLDLHKEEIPMKILVIGSGGREHAIIRKLKESKYNPEIYCAPGNGGIAADAVCVPLSAMDVAGVVKYAKENAMDWVFVTPDDPLAAGMVDALNEAGVKTFGPKKLAAEIESSKVFSKNMMKQFGIPTASYEVFTDAAKALSYVESNNQFPIVIKADGLALGKGVIIAKTLTEAQKGIRDIMEDKVFGASGNQIVVEEFLTGPEVSVLAFVDGETVKPMVSSMDHKRALDNDEGLNTGGMGTIAPNPFYTEEVAQQCMERIFQPTVKAMNELGRTFTGCLYFGLMITPKGPYVIEYNCRFGDPETQVVMELLDSDLVDIMEAIWQKDLANCEVKFHDGAAACVIIASGGYPKSYKKGCRISGLNSNGQYDGVSVYHAGTKLDEGRYLTSGGRVLGVTAKGADLKEALDTAYAAVNRISFENAFYRHDIGAKCLK